MKSDETSISFSLFPFLPSLPWCFSDQGISLRLYFEALTFKALEAKGLPVCIISPFFAHFVFHFCLCISFSLQRFTLISHTSR